MAQTPAPAPATARTLKQQFTDVYTREHATTIKVLNAFAQERASFKPHERSNSALQLAWTFVIENKLAEAALRGPLTFDGGFPPAPATFAEVMSAYRSTTREFLDTLAKTPDSRLRETIQFFTGPKQLGDFPVSEVLWLMLMDSVHHRGQFSVYLRMTGCKVPSIYGPTADEPWM
jgi:uncharacterized damage-inducible protein DinB